MNEYYSDGNLPADDVLARPLALAHFLLQGVQAFAHALSNLGAIDLPPIVGREADRSHVQAAVPLYLAAELEAARLIPAVEVLAGLFASGGLRLDQGEGAALLYRFWQQRHERFSQPERQAIFARLFGHPSDTRLAVAGSSNQQFEMQLAALANAIVASMPDPIFGSRLPGDAAITTAAIRVAAGLTSRSGGITAFAAQKILKTVEDALAILKQRPVQVAVGAMSVWTAVAAITRLYLQEDVDVSAHVQRGRSGMVLLTWVSEITPRLETVSAPEHRPPEGHPVYHAASAWLQATASLQAGPADAGWPQGLAFPISGALVRGRG